MAKYILGLMFQGQNPSACLLKDEEIVALVEEERFTREKHANNAFPINSVKYCLKSAGISIEDVDTIAIGWDAKKFDDGTILEFFIDTLYKYKPVAKESIGWYLKRLNNYTSKNLIKRLKENLGEKLPRVEFVPHHLSHAASAIFLSGFKTANILTMDGHGEEDCTVLWHHDGKSFKKLEQSNLPNSLGWFYTKFTEFFSFKPHDGEGKTMALASYGKPNKNIMDKVDKVIEIREDSYKINAEFFYGQRHPEFKSYTKKFIEIFGEPAKDKNYFEEYYKNLAFAVQNKLEEVVLMLVKKQYALTNDNNFCFAGGTFMNCKLNGKVVKEDFVNNLFVNPLSSDNGISLGAALYIASKLGINNFKKLTHVYYGPEYSNEQIEAELDNFKDKISWKKVGNIAEEAAKFIYQSKIIAWFQGRMEAGARALGHRSILANPLDEKAKDIVNLRVKFREMWRPFCPSVTEEDAKTYFDIRAPSEFMIIAADAKKNVKKLMPSVVHVDNTIRPQEVSKAINPKYWELINNFSKLSKNPVILNTSFNVKGEPIICSPKEAIECLLKTGIHYLCIGDFIVSKK